MGVVNLVDPATGQVRAFDERADANALAMALHGGWTVEGAPAAAQREVSTATARQYEGTGDQLAAGAGSFLSGATLGLSDLALRGLDPATAAEQARQRAAHPTTSTVSGIAGAVLPAILSGGESAAGSAAAAAPSGAVARLGARIAAAGEGAGTLGRIGRAAAGAAVEGAAQGVGSGISELALSEEPVDVERAVATLSSKALYGAAIGGAAGTLAKGVEIGLTKARRALDEAAERTERDAIEATRVDQRKDLADEITAFRRGLKAQKQFLITKDVDLPAAGEKLGAKELGRIAVKANKQLDNILDNPTGLMKNPGKALDALQRQENALAKIAARTDDFRAAFAADTSGTRAAALDTIAPALERNRALQARIAQAKEALAAAKAAPKTLAEQMAGGAAYSAVAGAITALPIPGAGLLGPMLGARAAGLIGEKVFGRLGTAMAEGQARTARAIGALFEVGGRAAKAAPPLATRVLAGVAFAPSSSAESPPPPTAPSRQRLARAFHARSSELREQVATGPTGAPVTRPESRQRIAAALQPIAVHQPVLADRMETLAARRLEFIAGKLPRRPDLGAMQLGPDHWQPSDMEMRTWARYVAAAEDPDGIVERLAHGAVTPEDAETMRTLYPEQLADITRQILERLPTLQRTLPYHRRLALSVLTGVPVDPSMDPRILAVLQGQYLASAAPPRPTPQFGSVKARDNDPGTLSERREREA